MVEGTRSNLAYAFLALVERHRPPAILLENVPGLLSSHGGRDMAALLGRLAELGYGVAYRILDARHFGVPQRRRRVFIVGLRSDPDDPTGRVAAERAASVLAVGARCQRHPPTGIEAGPGAADGTPERFDGVGSLDTSLGHHGGAWGDQTINAGHVIAHALSAPRTTGRLDPNGEDFVVGPPPDAHRNGKTDGLAGRSHDRDGVAGTLREHPRPGSNSNGALIAATLNSGGNDGGFRTEPGEHLAIGERRMTDDPLLPLGLDSHRYRCCGNGVVANVAEWIARQLLAALEAAA